MKLPKDVMDFLEARGTVIVSTFDEQGRIHCSVKGLVGIEESGKILVIDLYLRRTFENLERNSAISLTAVDEQNFIGFTLQGKAKMVPQEEMQDQIIHRWGNRIVRRISDRVMRNLQANTMTSTHHEAVLPEPKYLMEVEVENIIDLSPPDK